MSLSKEFTKGLWKEIPPFRLVLGLCPTLGVTTTAVNGLGMGLATTFVLIWSNVIISLIKGFVPKEVRIASYIVVIASFTVIVEMITHAYLYFLFESLGIFIPLIVVNCILLGRAEAFASKRGILPSLADGAGMGLGFTLSLTALGVIREVLGSGTLGAGTEQLFGVSLAVDLFGSAIEPMGIMQQPPGAFVCLGLMLGAMNLLGRRRRSGAEEI